jgi:photosystem II stability/assembly factor-like uncharacterized protein
VPILTVAIDPQNVRTLYAVAGLGIFRSRDGGTSWSKNSELPNPCFGSPTVLVDSQSPATLFYSDVCSGVFKSTDGGASWNAANSGLPTNCDVLCPIFGLAIDPQNSSTMYASSFYGLFKSTDGAASWTASGLKAGGTGTLAIDPQSPRNVFAGANDGLAQGGVFKSTDGGANWNPINSGLRAIRIGALVADPKTPGTLYANVRAD